MTDIYTEDFRDFGSREIAEAGQLLMSYSKGRGVPDNFYDEGVRVGFNRNSGYVFLTNDDYQALMLDDDDSLYMYYSTPYEGREGSFEDLMSEYKDMHPEDQEFMNDLKEYHGGA